MTNGHPLRLYNSLGRRVEDFVPSGDVTGMYSCGPTVYAYQRRRVPAGQRLRAADDRVRGHPGATRLHVPPAVRPVLRHRLGGAKMAKSAGGAPRLADLTEAGYHPAAFRLFLLGGHYRSQLDFTTAAIDAPQAILRRLTARVQPLRPLPTIETLGEAGTDDPAGVQVTDTPEGPSWQLR